MYFKGEFGIKNDIELIFKIFYDSFNVMMLLIRKFF
jgi:hypothetical protein